MMTDLMALCDQLSYTATGKRYLSMIVVFKMRQNFEAFILGLLRRRNCPNVLGHFNKCVVTFSL